jgi:hypothetical protein
VIGAKVAALEIVTHRQRDSRPDGITRAAARHSPPDRSDRDAHRRGGRREAARAAVSKPPSLVERYTTCNNPNCRCADPNQRHGPYWQLSWKQGGKTISKILSPEDAALYREWIENRRRLEATLEQMRDLSHQAGEQILANRERPFHGPERPRRRRPSTI